MIKVLFLRIQFSVQLLQLWCNVQIESVSPWLPALSDMHGLAKDLLFLLRPAEFTSVPSLHSPDVPFYWYDSLVALDF